MPDEYVPLAPHPGEVNRANRARANLKHTYENTSLDEFLQGIFGKQEASGSVLDPDHESKAAASNYGQIAGIGLDLADLPKAGAVALLGALKKSGKAGDAVGLARGGREVIGEKIAKEMRARPGAADNTTDAFLDAGIETVPEVKAAIEAAQPPTRAVQAPREISADKRFKGGDKKGIYRGTEAFGGITPQKLGAARKNYLADVEAGAPHSKYWYDDTSEALFDLTGGKVPAADDLAHGMSVTSSSTGVGTNANFGFKGWNQHLVGDPIKTGRYPERMSEDIRRGWSGEDVARGLKRDPYKGGLSVHWRPDPDLRPTNDIHQMRAWGVTDPKTGKPWSKGVSEAGHRFIDDQSRYATAEMNKRALARGEEPDWNNYRVQAAAWSPQRVKTGQAENLDEAGKHYGDFINDYSAHVTREWVPGETSGHLSEMLRDAGQKKEYSDAMEGVVQGRKGIDQLGHEMGVLSAPTMENRGLYEGVVSPGYVSRIPVGKATGSHAMDPSSEKAVRAVAAAHGLVGVQDQSAYNFLSGKPTAATTGGYRFERGTPFSHDDLAQLQARIEPLGLDIPQVDPRGARALYFNDPPDNKLSAELRKVGDEFGSKLIPHERSGAVFPTQEGSDYLKPEKWSSKPFIAGVEQGGPKMVAGFDNAMKYMAGEMLQHTQQLAAKHGWTQAHWYEPMMNALSTGGLAALKELVKKGVVPVAVLGTLGAMASGGEQPD